MRDDKVVTKNLLLASKVVTLKGAEVRADREEQTTQVRTSVRHPPADIKRIPSFGGAPTSSKPCKSCLASSPPATKADSSTSAGDRPSRTR